MIWTVGAIVIAVWIGIELGLALLVRHFRTDFPWLIGLADIAPAIDHSVIKKHIARSFDPELGWLRGPGSTGEDRTAGGVTRFEINKQGERTNPSFDGRPSRIAAFGDSFTLCRLVNNDETWPYRLSRALHTNVRNFGVGNWGLDQALLRLERELPRLDSEVIVMGVVPESMARIHSYWKHYFEYGNTLAFKPRFTLSGGVLEFHAPAIKSAADFAGYRRNLAEIQRLDGFYKNRFRKHILRLPYLFAVLRSLRRYGPILGRLILGALTGQRDANRRAAFAHVIADNARATARLYRDDAARALYSALVERFATVCHDAGRKPILLILPQPIDIARMDRGHRDYHDFIAGLSGKLPVLDLSDAFHSAPDRNVLYVEGPLGPHVSAEGNQKIAEAIRPLIANSLAASPARADRQLKR